MINRIHALLHRPERGWDPIPAEHVERYGEEQWRCFNPLIIERLETRIGALEGRRILDLGGGPGQFSIAFARKGARVTWHDVSRQYLEMAREKALQAAVSVQFSLGYLEEAARLAEEPFDLVFCRGCWRYCMNDRFFAGLIFSLVAPGGAGYVDSCIGPGQKTSWPRSIQYRLNANRGWKIGHPDPPRGRIAALFQGFAVESLETDYSAAENDRIFFVRQHQQGRG